jgi:hypothetical protein
MAATTADLSGSSRTGTTMPKVGIMLYGHNDRDRDASDEQSYRVLVQHMVAEGCVVNTLTFRTSQVETVRSAALGCDAVLTWINPVEPGLDRPVLDQLLREISTAGVFVSAHPDVILKIGTKDILVETQAIGWNVDDTDAYRSAEEFRAKFSSRLHAAGSRVLKRLPNPYPDPQPEPEP